MAGSPPLPPTEAPVLTDDALFAELEAALVLEGRGACRDLHPDPEAATVNHVFLPNGDVHICRGPSCPHLELNVDKHYVCSISGIVFGCLTVRDDHSTGRNAGSTNPDDHCGEPVGGSWRPKKDQVALSHFAYQAAETAEAKEQDGQLYVATTPPRKAARGAAKRGARCVDDQSTPEPQADVKRPRHARRSADSREEFVALCADAQGLMNKLLNFEKRTEAKKPAAETRTARVDAGALFDAAVKKYTKECVATNQRPTLDAVHNLALIANRVAAEQRRKETVGEGRNAALLKVRTRESVCALAVNLWLASCAAPYMAASSKRGADSFRPFVAGVLYALKRGVALADGTAVVPQLPQLADALPALRATAANSAAKAIHASSHRGLCTLHRSIASCDAALAAKLYGDVARQARQLEDDVKSGRVDI